MDKQNGSHQGGPWAHVPLTQAPCQRVGWGHKSSCPPTCVNITLPCLVGVLKNSQQDEVLRLNVMCNQAPLCVFWLLDDVMGKDLEMMCWKGAWGMFFWQRQGMMRSEPAVLRVWIWEQGRGGEEATCEWPTLRRGRSWWQPCWARGRKLQQGRAAGLKISGSQPDSCEKAAIVTVVFKTANMMGHGSSWKSRSLWETSGPHQWLFQARYPSTCWWGATGNGGYA